MKYAQRYPWERTSYLLEPMGNGIFRSVQEGRCLRCDSSCNFISYAFPRQGVPVCSEECHRYLESLQTEAKKIQAEA